MELTLKQKQEIKKLMDEYFDNKSKFVYEGGARRESYAHPNSTPLSRPIDGCITTSKKYLLNCGLLAQMIWMGRKITDFTTTPSRAITPSFDWGYYFDFLAAQNAYGVVKDNGTMYSANTYVTATGEHNFITFDNAAAMAMELYYKGYEVPYSQVDIGDLVFYRTPSEVDGSKDELEQSSFRSITHVGLVYDLDSNRIPTILECSDAYAAVIGKASLSKESGVTKFGMVRGAGLTYRVVMAARHPAAYRDWAGNVPSEFTTYRHQ